MLDIIIRSKAVTFYEKCNAWFKNGVGIRTHKLTASSKLRLMAVLCHADYSHKIRVNGKTIYRKATI